MHQYLKDLRKAAGHIPILVCGASAILENTHGEILLHLRRDNGCWAYPGGAVDINESVEDAVRREIREETGLIIRSMRLFGVYSGKDMYHVYPNGDEISSVDIVFQCDDFEGEPKPDHSESEEVRFFPLDRLPDQISPPCRRAIAGYIATRNK